MNILRACLLRSLKPYWAVVLAMTLVLALAVALWVMAATLWQALTDSQAQLYQRTHFAQGFGHLTRAPLPLANRLMAQAGVGVLEVGLQATMRLRLSDSSPWFEGRAMALPKGEQPLLNRLILLNGPNRLQLSPQDAIVNTAFAKANHLRLGQGFEVLMNGRLYSFRLVAMAYSPEFVYSLKPGALAPNDKEDALIWVHAQVLEAALDMKGAFNRLSFTLAPNAYWPSVKRHLDALLAPYGGKGVYPREKQLSHRFIQQELQQLKTLAVFLPGVFMAVALFMLHLFIIRVFIRQKASIALCKALGYSSRHLAVPYWQCVGLWAALAVALGVALGQWLAQGLGRLYQQFFKFPSLWVPLYPQLALTALGLTLSAAFAVLAWAMQQLHRVPPAVAMRPDSPQRYRPSLLDWLNQRWPLAGRYAVGLQALIVARHWQRKPLRTLGSMLALALGFSLLVVSGFQQGAIEYMLNAHFKAQQRMDATLIFNRLLAQKPLQAWQQLPGLLALQGFRQVQGRIQQANKEWTFPVWGLPAQKVFLHLPCQTAAAAPLAEDGVYLSAYLAKTLGLQRGDAVYLQLQEGENPLLRLRLDGLCSDYFGLNAYMKPERLHQALHESPVNSGAWITLEPRAWPIVKKQLEQAPVVASISQRRALIAQFEQQMQDSIGVFSGVSLLFALAVALAVLVLMVQLYWEEHARVLALMHAIGFYKSQLIARCWLELSLLLLVAWPLGLLMGVALCYALTAGMQTELYRVPLVVAPSLVMQVYGLAVLLSLLLAAMVALRAGRLPVLTALKSSE